MGVETGVVMGVDEATVAGEDGVAVGILGRGANGTIGLAIFLDGLLGLPDIGRESAR